MVDMIDHIQEFSIFAFLYFPSVPKSDFNVFSKLCFEYISRLTGLHERYSKIEENVSMISFLGIFD